MKCVLLIRVQYDIGYQFILFNQLYNTFCGMLISNPALFVNLQKITVINLISCSSMQCTLPYQSTATCAGDDIISQYSSGKWTFITKVQPITEDYFNKV